MQLVINTFGATLRKEGDRFVITAGSKKLAVSAHKVQSILISTAAFLSTDAVELAATHNIDLVFLSKHGDPYGRLWQSRMGSTAAIRRRQIEVADSPERLDKTIRYPIQSKPGKTRNVKQCDILGHEAHALANALLGKCDLPMAWYSKVEYQKSRRVRQPVSAYAIHVPATNGAQEGLRSQFVTSKKGSCGRRYLHYALEKKTGISPLPESNSHDNDRTFLSHPGCAVTFGSRLCPLWRPGKNAAGTSRRHLYRPHRLDRRHVCRQEYAPSGLSDTKKF
jgi:hypothetical protein